MSRETEALIREGLPALSIRQPWAWLVANGHKDIENRTWVTGHRGRFLIHAGKEATWDEYQSCCDFAMGVDRTIQMPPFCDLPRGGIVGVAEIVGLDFGEDGRSPWFTGSVGFVIRNARPLPFLPCKGALGFFRPTLP